MTGEHRFITFAMSDAESILVLSEWSRARCAHAAYVAERHSAQTRRSNCRALEKFLEPRSNPVVIDSQYGFRADPAFLNCKDSEPVGPDEITIPATLTVGTTSLLTGGDYAFA